MHTWKLVSLIHVVTTKHTGLFLSICFCCFIELRKVFVESAKTTVATSSMRCHGRHEKLFGKVLVMFPS